MKRAERQIKRQLALILILLLSVSIFPMRGAGAEMSLLQNGGFEGWKNTSSLATGWSVAKAGGSIVAETADVAENSISLKLKSVNGQTSEMTAKQTVTGLSGGTLYELTLDFKISTPLAASKGFSAEIADSGGVTLVKTDAPVSQSDGTWMQISLLFTAPVDGMVQVKLSFLPDGTTKSILLDNVRIIKAEKGKMKLYKSPIGYVLPGVVTSRAEARERLPAFMSGAAGVFGGTPQAVTDDAVVRVVPQNTNARVLCASYSALGNELTAFETAAINPYGILSAVLTRGKTVKGFIWDNKTLSPLERKTQIAYPQEELTLVRSGDFESYIGATVYGWSAYKGWNSGFCTFEKDLASGNHTMCVSDTTGGNTPFVYQKIDIAPSTKYRLSLGCKQADIDGKGAGVKLEFYDKEGTSTGDRTEYIPQTTETFSFDFETPAAAARVNLYLRMYSKGKVHFDNVSMTCISTPSCGSILTDEYFYYPEWKTAKARILANTISYPSLSGGTYDIRLLDGQTLLLEEKERRLSDGEGVWTFAVSHLKTAGKAYTVEADVFDTSGIYMGTCQKTVYQYPKPSVLDENGNYRNKDGTIFVPRLAYHVAGQNNALTEEGKQNYQYAKDAGMNVIQLSTGCIYDPENTLQILDILDAMGLKALLPLYDKRKAAGSAYHERRTKTLVEKVKNHPAVFAYGIYDEPSIGADGLTEEDLINSYRIIRDIDKVHPTYTVIAPGKSDSADIVRAKLTKYTDVICYDPYPGCWDSAPATYVAEVHKAAKESVMHNRPVYSLLQVFDWRAFFPTADEYRHMWYQAALEGAKGIGIFSFNDARVDTSGEALGLWTSDIWKDITAFAKSEMLEAEKHFMHGTYPIFTEGETAAYRYRAWEKGTDIYMVILRTDPYTVTAKERAEDVTTDIPLKKYDNTKQIGRFTAECVYGGGKDVAVSGNGTLTVTIGHRQALVYKITRK